MRGVSLVVEACAKFWTAWVVSWGRWVEVLRLLHSCCTQGMGIGGYSPLWQGVQLQGSC